MLLGSVNRLVEGGGVRSESRSKKGVHFRGHFIPFVLLAHVASAFLHVVEYLPCPRSS